MRSLRPSSRRFSSQGKSAVHPQSGDLTPDENPVIAGYRVGGLLGQGPLGKVYRAQHEQTGQKVVIRGFARPEEVDPAEWEQAKNQFRDLLLLHQRIADMPDAPSTIQKVVAFGEENGLFWIATEYFEGANLRAVLEKEGVLPLTRIIEILRPVAEAVDWMGSRGLPHTDLTPYNIVLVNQSPGATRPILHVEVINFGLAHARDKFGSPYAAPEQMEGVAGDRRSDVYAVGAMLHEMLTGVPLFSGQTPEEVTQKVLYSPPQILIQRPQAASKIVFAMVARQPEWRYQTVGEAIQDLINNREPRFAVPDPFAGAQAVPSPVPASPVYVAQPVPSSAPISTYPAPHVSMVEVRRPAKPEITMQSYRLADQDLIILRWRAEQAKRRQEEARDAQRERIMPWVKGGAWIAVPCLIFLWALNWRDSYRYITVQRASGQVTVRENGVTHPLHVGDRIRADRHPLILTGPRSSAALAMPDSRLFLPPRSALGVLHLDYNWGTVRHLELLSGSVVGMLEKNRTVRRFDVRVANVLARIKGTYFFLTIGQQALVAGTKQGALTMEFNGQKQPIGEGKAVALSRESSVPEPIAMEEFAPLTRTSEKVLAKVPTTAPPVIETVAEKIATPTLSLGDTLWKLPTKANDQRSIGMSIVGMQSLCTLLLSADNGEGLPATLNLKTLQELGMEEKDRQRILNLFDGHQLLSYRKLPGGGYEIYARSTDSDHSLMRGSNGHVEVLGSDSGEEETKE